MAATLLVTLLTLVVAMSVLWLVSLVRTDASIVDPFWGLGFVLVGAIVWSRHPSYNTLPLLLLLLTTIWGLRLSVFLWWRNRGHGEDRRYSAMRAYHGKQFWWVSLGTVFLLQATILWFISLTIQVGIASSLASPSIPLAAIGVALWLIGFLFETIGDFQLAKFKSNPSNAGRVMDRGLWRFTRHPNYFGDCCEWWGLYLIAAANGATWTIVCPVLMTILLLKVSGVVLLEQTIVERRPEYLAYQQRTSSFFPWPPRQK